MDSWFEKHLEDMIEEDDGSIDDDEDVQLSDFDEDDSDAEVGGDYDEDKDITTKALQLKKMSLSAVSKENEESVNLAFDNDSDVDVIIKDGHGSEDNQIEDDIDRSVYGDVTDNVKDGDLNGKKRVYEDRNEAAMTRRYGVDVARKIKRVKQSFLGEGKKKGSMSDQGNSAFASAEDFEDLLDL